MLNRIRELPLIPLWETETPTGMTASHCRLWRPLQQHLKPKQTGVIRRCHPSSQPTWQLLMSHTSNKYDRETLPVSSRSVVSILLYFQSTTWQVGFKLDLKTVILIYLLVICTGLIIIDQSRPAGCQKTNENHPSTDLARAANERTHVKFVNDGLIKCTDLRRSILGPNGP